MMRNFCFLIIVFIVGLSSCVTVKPKGFTYPYTAKYTGLDTLINIDGCYISSRECDSTFYSVFMFYPDDLFTIATTSNPQELLDCFENGGKSNLCKYPSWGTYYVENNIIKTQVVAIEGIGACTIFRDYEIGKDGSLTNISDYVGSENTNLGYMKNYPSFTKNPCRHVSSFYPLKRRRNVEDCPFIGSKWFYLYK